MGVGCGWVPGGGEGSSWGPWVCVVDVGQGGLCVVKSGGKACVCWFGVVRGEWLFGRFAYAWRSRSHMGVWRKTV